VRWRAEARDISAILRNVTLAPCVLPAVWSRRAVVPELERSYDSVVAPIVDHAIVGESLNASVHNSLRSASSRYGYVMHAYALMSRVPLAVEIAVLAGSFAHLYDNIIDEFEDASFDDRLVDLVLQETPAQNELELLLAMVFLSMYERLDESRVGAVYSAFSELHEHQHLSRLQKDPSISDHELVEITRMKARSAAVVLCTLVKPDLTDHEKVLISQIGEIVQLLDDHTDLADDQRLGIKTLAANGQSCLDLASRDLRALRTPLRRYYGKRQARPFLGLMYGFMLTAFARRQSSTGEMR
jgi:hypothetical protein